MRSYVREALKRTAQGEKKGKTSFTASDTGARREALKRLGRGQNSFGGYVKNMVKGGIKGGIQERAPSQAEMEETIKKGR